MPSDHFAEAHSHLQRSDIVMSDVVQKVGVLSAPVRCACLFTSLARIVVGQQLSTKAASTIFNRISKAVEPFDAPSYLATTVPNLRSTGLSRAKEGYIRGIAEQIRSGNLDWSVFDGKSDDEVFEILTSIKGIGSWSADMFLIFDLERPDIFSPNDAGLRQAICQLYKLSIDDYTNEISRISERWSPFRSTACRYLWHWLDNET